MTDQIMNRELVRARARRAFKAGKGRDEHEMNWHAAALPTWLKEWDRLDAERKHEARHAGERQFFKVIGQSDAGPQSHFTGAACAVFDARQLDGGQ